MPDVIDEGNYQDWCSDRGVDHRWSDWSPSMVDALLECRFCSVCGGMEQQWICIDPECVHDDHPQGAS